MSNGELSLLTERLDYILNNPDKVIAGRRTELEIGLSQLIPHGKDDMYSHIKTLLEDFNRDPTAWYMNEITRLKEAIDACNS